MIAKRCLLDTSALLAHARREPGWARVASLLDDHDLEVLASTVSLTELARRFLDLGAPAEEALRVVEDYRELVDEIVVVDERVALTAVDLGRKTPERLPLADALIAACALARGAQLVHRDRHMAAIPADLLDQVDLAKEPASE